MREGRKFWSKFNDFLFFDEDKMAIRRSFILSLHPGPNLRLASRSITLGMTDHAEGKRPPKNRRRHRRLPVTVCARVHHADVTYRTDILDVSDEGMLLASGGGLVVTRDQVIEVDSSALGKVVARVVGVSRMGIHVQLESCPPGYQASVERLFALTRAWLP